MRLYRITNWLLFMFTGNRVEAVGTVADNLCSNLVVRIISHKLAQLTDLTLILLVAATMTSKYDVNMNSAITKCGKNECE